MQPHNTSATAMAAALAAGATSARELIEEAIGAALSTPAVHCLTNNTFERGRHEADLSDQRRAGGRQLSPLDGVPVTWKDLFDVRGTVTTCGSESRLHLDSSSRDSAFVAACADVGMISVGKTNMSEFAFSGLGVNTVFGTPVNPAHTDTPRVPGGSSSGAAVSVAVGVAPYAIGTDTSGSTRLPAAWCGVVGYRASKNRYGPNDFQPLSQTLDSVGLIARTVQDIRLLDDIMLKRHRAARYPLDSSTPRFVVPDGELIDECHPDIAAAFTEIVSALSAAGATIEHRVFTSLNDAQSLMDSCGTIVGAEARSNIRGEVNDTRLLQPATVRRLTHSARTNNDPAQLYARLPDLRHRFQSELGDEVLLCPTVRIPPPAISTIRENAKSFDYINQRALRSTMLTSYLGACGISYPAAPFASASGLMMSRPCGDDDRLLAAASFIELADARDVPARRYAPLDPTCG
ncbi:amidase family protein [Mycolicibacterium helvum]|uniref:Amidase domain-containing protein n=1 Tax=Mycolicibacterium helvum TaxID=1534349 RepID=A0A7I7T9D1_9MYCO|nr:amidase family protein [Mycolicibacterium helvum]BBY65887.1 hypothetical protein MHEL_41300 [Mycolicibacterium helvum]